MSALDSAMPAVKGRTSPKEWVRVECACGEAVGAMVGHYDRMTCGTCGTVYWALQPKRGGALAGYAWPGGFVAST